MSYPLVHPDSGFEPPDELKDLMPLSEVLGGTSFVSNNGRVYRLFGSEERAFAMPDLPEIPPLLAAPKSSPLSLEEAIQQIETFSFPKAKERDAKERDAKERDSAEQLQPSLTIRTEHSPALQLLQALEESAIPHRHVDVGIPLKLVNSDNTPPNPSLPTPSFPSPSLSVKEVVREVSQVLPGVAQKPSEERRQSLRIVPDLVEGPFIVPFAKPETPSEETETKRSALKVVTECVPPILGSHVLRKSGEYRRKGKVSYRKLLARSPVSVVPVAVVPDSDVPGSAISDSVIPDSVAPVSVALAMELSAVSEQKPPVDRSAFRWSAQLDSLMLTARDQIRMLTDHLAVQQNQGIKGICFKSVFPGDGCSTVLLCAVRALLERDYRILLIDAHHRHIDLPKQLNLSGNWETGNEVIALNDQLGVWVWQESKTVEENTALIAEIVATHRENYDFILLDDGSVTESPLMAFVTFWDQIALSGVVLVSNMKRPSEMPISHVARRLRQYHIPLIGVAENYV